MWVHSGRYVRIHSKCMMMVCSLSLDLFTYHFSFVCLVIWDCTCIDTKCNYIIVKLMGAIPSGLLEFSVKSGKHSTRTLSFMSIFSPSFLFPEHLHCCYIYFLVKLRNAPFFVLNWVSSCFDLFPERLHCYHIYFHCSYLFNYYNYLEPCALNAEFQHYIPRFNKISLLWGPYWKRGQGVKGGPKTGWL
jgi:hypothetical protein